MNKHHYCIILLLLGSACRLYAQDIDPASDLNAQPGSSTSLNGYQLSWSDEFNGTSVDTSKWNYRQGDDSRTFVKSYQTAANNSESGGLYRCQLKKESLGTKEYTAGGLITKKRFRYGYYESRLKVPEGAGWHTSFWMMPRNAMGDPANIELDVFENDSKYLDHYDVNIHRWKPDPHVTFGTKKVDTPFSLAAGFHVFGCEFTPELVNYYMDGVLIQSVDATQFEHSDVNIWVTSLGLCYNTDVIDDSMLPEEAQYDYVRYFELGPHATVEITSPSSGRATLTDTNTTVGLTAAAAAVNTAAVPTIIWSQLDGPGTVVFDDASSTNTGARFSADGLYELTCFAMIGSVTNADTLTISVNAPVTVTFQHGVHGYGNPCTFIRGDFPDVNSGADNEMIIGHWGSKALRGLLEFDLSTLDSSAVIQQAELKLYNYNGVGTVGAMELRELSTAFIEGTGNGNGWSDGNGAGTGATWTSRTGSQNWATAGGDFYPAALSSLPGYNATVLGYKTFSSSPGFVSAAQSALDRGQPLNLMVSSPATESAPSGNMSRLRSDDASSANERPSLTISYLGNFLPEIYAGPNLGGMISSPIALAGAAAHTDMTEWSVISGPGAVSFSDAGALSNSAAFSMPGRYRIRLSATNSRGTGFQDISVSMLDDLPYLAETAVSNGTFAFEFNSITGLTYTLQAATKLTRSWIDLYTTNAITDPMVLRLPVSTNEAAFYRLILKP